MGIELGIKQEGYPELLRKTGAQSPLQGPFWGLSSTVVPTFNVGNASVIPGQDFPYPFPNYSAGTVTSPAAETVAAQTASVTVRGFYGLKMEGYLVNSGLTGTYGRLRHRLWDGFSEIQPELFVLAPAIVDNGPGVHFDRRWI